MTDGLAVQVTLGCESCTDGGCLSRLCFRNARDSVNEEGKYLCLDIISIRPPRRLAVLVQCPLEKTHEWIFVIHPCNTMILL